MRRPTRCTTRQKSTIMLELACLKPAMNLPGDGPLVVEEAAGRSVLGERGEVDDDARPLSDAARTTMTRHVSGDIAGRHRVDLDVRQGGIRVRAPFDAEQATTVIGAAIGFP